MFHPVHFLSVTRVCAHVLAHVYVNKCIHVCSMFSDENKKQWEWPNVSEQKDEICSVCAINILVKVYLSANKSVWAGITVDHWLNVCGT